MRVGSNVSQEVMSTKLGVVLVDTIRAANAQGKISSDHVGHDFGVFSLCRLVFLTLCSLMCMYMHISGRRNGCRRILFRAGE